MGPIVRVPRYRPAVVPRSVLGPRVARLALALVVAVGVGCGDGEPAVDEQRAEQVGDAAAAAGLPEDVVAFLADAAAGGGSFRVAYEVADPDGGDPQRVTITQRGTDRRVDVEQADGEAQSTIGTVEGTHVCRRPAADEPWVCERSTEAPVVGLFDAEVVAALTEALTERADSYEFVVEDRTILGVEARCLVTTLRADVDDPSLGSAGTLCTSPEGAQLLTETPTGTFRAVEYTTAVPDDAFALPDAGP